MLKEKRTIAIVTPYFPPYGGGLERYSYEIASRLYKDLGWRVIVITSGERRGTDIKGEMDGLTIYRLSYWFKFSNTPISLAWHAKIRKILKEENPDVINIHMPVPGIGDIAARLAGRKPVVVTYHAGSMNKNRLAPDFFIWLYEHGPLHLLLRRANRIICASDFVRLEFLKKYLYKSVTVTPGVDDAVFMPADAKTKRENRPTVLFVGGLGFAEQHKGLHTLLDAATLVKKTIPDLKMMIVGDGDMRIGYELRTKELGLQDTVVFEGRMGGKALADKYREADIFTLPSSNENFSMSILEAMASGLPVVATNIGGIPLLVKDGATGYLVPPHDATALAEKMTTLLKDPALSATLGNAGRTRASNEFGWQERTKQYGEAFVKTLGARVRHIPRLIMVTPYFYPKFGGLEQYAHAIARRLHESGAYEVTVVTSNHSSKGYRQDVVNGMIVHRLPTWFRIMNTPVGLSWHRWTKRIFRAEQPDIVNAHTPVPFIADMANLARGRTPFVLTYHNDIVKDSLWANLFSKMAYIFGINGTLRSADRIIATSQYYAEHSPYLLNYRSKMSIVSPGVDLTRFNPQVSGKSVQEKYPGRRIILFVGGMNRTQQHKGLKDLITAFPAVHVAHKDALLMVVGSGDNKEMYQEFASRSKAAKEIVFASHVSDEELPSYYAAAYAQVLPSTNMSEGFGMVLTEANACGRPAVGTRIGGIPYAIEDGVTGLLVPPKDPKSLAATLNTLLADPELAERLGKAGAERVAKTFGWDGLVRKTGEIFSNAKMPTIAQVVSYYPPHLGGMEVVAKETALGLARRDYPVIVFASNVGAKKKIVEESVPHYEVRRLRTLEFARTPIIWSLPFRLLRLPKNSVIHVHVAQAGIPEAAWLAAKLRGLPLVAHFHLDVDRSGPLGGIFLWYKKHILVHVLRGADRVIVFSEEQSELVQTKYQVKKSAISIVPNGVGAEFFTNEIRHTPHSPLRLLYVGRLAVQKRVERLIEMMKFVKIPMHLSIVGDGEDRAQLEALTKSAGVAKHVSFEGRKGGEDLREAYRNADVFLTASDKEGMSLVALEAMASGLPVVGSNVIGTRELVHGVGVLVDAPYPSSFADAITKIANDPKLLETLSRQSAEKAQAYSSEKVIDRLQGVYKEVLA